MQTLKGHEMMSISTSLTGRHAVQARPVVGRSSRTVRRVTVAAEVKRLWNHILGIIRQIVVECGNRSHYWSER